MTVTESEHRDVPAERLAAFRIALGVFITSYLVLRSPVFVELGGREASRFEPVGVFRLIGSPMSAAVNNTILAATIASGLGFTLGWRYRYCAPVFAAGVLLLTTHRSSWGQMLHFENLMALHVAIVAFSRAADAWSIDARRSRPTRKPRRGQYSWPLQLASVVVVVTYVIAGVAKLRYGGIEWITGDTLRNHIAYSATRLELLGGSPSPLAAHAVNAAWALPPMAAASVAVELAAPIALLGGRWRNAWVASAWLMHASIYALMLVGFPSPLFLIAFAPFFKLEQLVNSGPAVWLKRARLDGPTRRSRSRQRASS